MRQSRKVLRVETAAASFGMQRAFFFLLFFVPVLLMAFGAYAAPGGAGATSGGATLETYASAVGEETNVLVDVFAYVSFIMGVVLSALGVDALRKHAENPQNQLKLAFSKLGFGGLFLAFPFIVDVVLTTMGGYDFDPFEILVMKSFTFGDTAIKGDGLGGLIKSGINNTSILVNVAAFAAFIIGCWFILRGIQMLRTHVESPQNAPLPESLKRLAVGGALLSLPMIVNIVFETFGALGGVIKNKGLTTESTGGGLDGLMVNFIKDISNPAYFAIEVFCYIAGVLLILFAMQRLVKTAQDGPNGPLGFGTISTFIIAGLLLSFPHLMATISTTIFGTSTSLTQVEFMSLSGAVDPIQIKNAKNVFTAVLAFMAVIGFLSVVRGLFLFKAFSQGNNQATMMSVVTHIVAGALCVNLGGFINAVQASLGLTGADIPVTFK